MVVAAVPDQLNALTAADKAQLDTAWHGSGLLQLTWQRAQHWATEAFQAVATTKQCRLGRRRIRIRWPVIWVARPMRRCRRG